MKIVQGLKQLRLIEKKMRANSEAITKYASQLSTERPIFETEKEQESQVTSLIQSNKDLFEEYLQLKDRIDRTNNTIEVTINDQTRTINQFLNIYRKLGNLLKQSYVGLNDTNASSKMVRGRGGHEEGTHIVRYYDEKEKNEQIRYWTDLIGEISGSLEVINATTDIVQ